LQENKPLNLDSFKGYLASSDPKQRYGALKAVIPYKDSRAVDYILPMIAKEPVLKIRLAMIRTVGLIGTPEQLNTLISLVEDRDAQVRMAVARAIVDLKHPPFFPLLVRLLGDQEDKIRTFCGQTLTKLGKESLFKLFKVMYLSPVPWMKRSSVRGCRQFRTGTLVKILEKALEDPDPNLQEEAKKGIQRLADHGLSRAKAALKRAKMPFCQQTVIAAKLPNLPGELAKASAKLARAKVNIHYVYGSTGAAGRDAMVVFGVDNLAKAAQLLK